MIYLIKFFFFLTISHYSFANENKTNQILFKINNKVFTNIDLEERKKYVGLINNLTISEFSKSENKEIYEALQSFNKAIKIQPKDFRSYHNLGTIYEKLGNMKRAKTYYKKVLDNTVHRSFTGIK